MGELETQQALTRAFIAARGPVTLTLTPQIRQANGSGGYKKVAGEPRPEPIVCTLIPQSQYKGSAGPTRTADGESDDLDFVMVAEVGAIVREDDFWLDGTYKWTVDYVYPSNGYETKAAVKRYGT